MDNSADDAEITRLMGELATAMDGTTRSTGPRRLCGDAMGELATAMDNSADEAEITRLTGEDRTRGRQGSCELDAMDNSARRLTGSRGLKGELATRWDNSADEAEIAKLMGELDG